MTTHEQRATSSEIWTVRAFERPNRRGIVLATRYHVIASTADEAIDLVRAEHERPELPETKGTRYTATAYGDRVQKVNSHSIAARTAEESIKAGIA